MAKLPSDSVAVPSILSSDSNAVKIYTAKSGTQWRLALIAFVFGAIGLIPLKHIIEWLSGGSQPVGREFVVAACALFFVPIGILCIANALRGLPRLTVTAEGIKFESGVRTMWTSWDSVGPFTVEVVSHSRFRQVRRASATKSDAGRNLARARHFNIPDQFTLPIDTIAAELNAARMRVTGDIMSASGVRVEEAIGLAQFQVPWRS